MSRPPRWTRRRPVRYRPRLEALESRRVLSFAVVAVGPPPAAPPGLPPSGGVTVDPPPGLPPSGGVTVDPPPGLPPAGIPGLLGVVAVDPLPGTLLTAPPAVVTVTFDRPIDPTS